MNEEFELWVFVPTDAACDTCAGMQGGYSYSVTRPHDNCKCIIHSTQVKAELQATRHELVDQYEMWEEVAWVPRGGSTSVEQNWSTGTETTVSGEVGAEGSGVNVTVGGSQTVTGSSGGSRTVTFPYDADVGGASQLVAAVYQVKVFQVIGTYKAHWSVGMGTDFEFEVVASTREERAFSGYRTVAF